MTCATALGCRILSPAAPDASLDQAVVLAALRARVARLEGAGRAPHAAGAIPICEGVPLPGGGLARAAVHEVLATSPGCGTAFCAVLLARTGGLGCGSGHDTNCDSRSSIRRSRARIW